MDREKRYHYTEPETNNTKDAIEVKVPVYQLPFLRAFCHTHPTNGGFSAHDFEQFKKLKRVIKDKKLKQEIVSLSDERQSAGAAVEHGAGLHARHRRQRPQRRQRRKPARSLSPRGRAARART